MITILFFRLNFSKFGNFLKKEKSLYLIINVLYFMARLAFNLANCIYQSVLASTQREL